MLLNMQDLKPSNIVVKSDCSLKVFALVLFSTQDFRWCDWIFEGGRGGDDVSVNIPGRVDEIYIY